MSSPPGSTIFNNAVIEIAGIIEHIFFEVSIVAVLRNQVFLVQGEALQQEGGNVLPSAVVEQCVVVARDLEAVMTIVDRMVPAFRVAGVATLHEYELTAMKLRATLNGDDTGWPLYVDPEVEVLQQKF